MRSSLVWVVREGFGEEVILGGLLEEETALAMGKTDSSLKDQE